MSFVASRVDGCLSRGCPHFFETCPPDLAESAGECSVCTFSFLAWLLLSTFCTLRQNLIWTKESHISIIFPIFCTFRLVYQWRQYKAFATKVHSQVIAIRKWPETSCTETPGFAVNEIISFEWIHLLFPFIFNKVHDLKVLWLSYFLRRSSTSCKKQSNGLHSLFKKIGSTLNTLTALNTYAVVPKWP